MPKKPWNPKPEHTKVKWELNDKLPSIYESNKEKLQDKNRQELIEKLKKLWKILEQDKRELTDLYAQALPTLPATLLKRYEAARGSCTKKDFLLNSFNDLSRLMSDDQLRSAIAEISSGLRTNKKREFESTCAQSRTITKGRQKGRAYPTFIEH